MQIGFQVNPTPNALDLSAVELLRGIPTAILSDNMARLFAVGPALRPYHGGAALVGSALTVRTRPGDNLMVHKAVDMAQPGDVIVVDAGGDLTNAIVGEILIALARRRGVAGYVVDGAVRDVDAIAASDFPVYARGVTHRGPYKDGPGEINVTVSVGGQTIAPGDVVVGDGDGVLAVPRKAAARIAELARAQMGREAATLRAIADGSIDRSWVDDTLRAKGLGI
ncbi:MAG TPA: RraA family protein [Beijerinckiaceae bacterium]|nr:RraA family protein [Beijerinckiaceae bacterium]